MLIGDLRRILKCAVFLKENRILLLTEELDLHSRFELHENLRKFIDVGFECRNFHGDFTISHVGDYPDLVSIAAHVIVDGLDQTLFMIFPNLNLMFTSICLGFQKFIPLHMIECKSWSMPLRD